MPPKPFLIRNRSKKIILVARATGRQGFSWRGVVMRENVNTPEKSEALSIMSAVMRYFENSSELAEGSAESSILKALMAYFKAHGDAG